MKILLVVHQTLPYYIGGVECLTHDFVIGLKEAGHEPLVFSKIHEGAIPVFPVNEDYNNYIRIPISHCHRLKDEFANETVLDAFKNVLEDFHPDFVHIMHLQYLHYQIANYVKKKDIPLVTSVFDYWFFCRQVQRLYFDGSLCLENTPERCQKCNVPLKLRFAHFYRIPLFRVLYRHFGGIIDESISIYQKRQKELALVLENSDVVCFATRALRRFYEERYKIKKVMMVPYGIREPAHKNVRFESSTDRILTFGFIGTCAPHKGVLQLIEAFQELERPRCQLVLYLNDTQKSAYSKLVREAASNKSNIEIRAPFPFEQIYKRLLEFDTLVIPSVWDENMPLVLLAALNQQVPVLGGNVPGITDFVQNDKTGLLFNPYDKKALIRSMESFVDRVRAGWLPQFENTSLFSIRGYVEKNLKIYNQLGDFSCVEFVES